MTLEETVKNLKKRKIYSLNGKGRENPSVKIESIKDDKIIIRVPYNQELKSSKTTEIYTHVSKKAIDKAKNPLNDLF